MSRPISTPIARTPRAILAPGILALLLLATPAQGAAPSPLVIAKGHFTAANDNAVKPTAPRGSATFKQRGPAAKIIGNVHLRGMKPSTSYVAVPYVDPFCTPAPGVTAYPSSQFVTDSTGTYIGPITVNPAAVNPLATLDISKVKSVSIRGVLASPPPPAPPTVPDPVFESCDTMPVIG